MGILLLASFILACQASDLIATPTPLPPTATVPSSTATITFTPTQTFTPTPTTFLGLLDYPITMVAGGFALSPLRGYDRKVNTYEAFLSSPDEKVTFYFLSETKPSGRVPSTVVKSWMEYFQSSIHDYNEGEGRDVVIDSAKGYSKDFTGTVDEEPVRGRITVVFPDDSKILTIIMQVLGDGRWEREGELAYKVMVEKISFFKPTASEACPVAKNREYGFSENFPIKIGGGESDGPDREREYLNALLGPHGEIVEFYRDDPIKKDNVILDKYIIRYKSISKTIFMDMYNYNNPNIPFGFTCSTVAPLSK